MPSARTLMFAGFRSRWMIPCSCAASSASAICFAIGSASSSGIAPRAIRCDRSSPSTSSITSARTPPALFEAVDVRDVRMIQRGEGLRFALEAREPVGVARERLGQDLDRDVAIELRVARPIDLAHAAFADLRGDFVDAETGAGSEGHRERSDYTGRDSKEDGLLLSERERLQRRNATILAPGRTPTSTARGASVSNPAEDHSKLRPDSGVMSPL